MRPWSPALGLQSLSRSSVQSLSHVQLFVKQWNHSMPGFPVHHQLLELTQTRVLHISDALQPSRPLSFFLLLPSTFPSIRGFSKESVLHIRWPKDWNFSFSVSPSNDYSRRISFRMEWLDLSLKSKGLSRVFSNITVQKHQLFGAQLSL